MPEAEHFRVRLFGPLEVHVRNEAGEWMPVPKQAWGKDKNSHHFIPGQKWPERRS